MDINNVTNVRTAQQIYELPVESFNFDDIEGHATGYS